MRSLRGRLVTAVLVLAAAGLVLLAAVTYAEQHSFLMDRADQQVREAPGAVAHQLRDQGVGPPINDRDRDGDTAGGRAPAGGGGGGPNVGLPPGTYGQRRSASGKVLGDVVLSYGQTAAKKPVLPSHLELDHPVTVGSGSTSFRVMASADPSGAGTTVVAVPLREADETLDRLLVVEALVIGGVLVLLGIAAWFVVRVGLLPLNRMAGTAGAIAGGDLSHRVEDTDPRSEVGRLGRALNAMLDRLEQAFAQREASEERLRRFLADASHELRTPLVSIRGYAELFRLGAASGPEDTAKAMRRIEEEAARMGVLVEDLLTLARLDEIKDSPHERVDLGAIAADAVQDARAAAPDRQIALEAGTPVAATGNPDQLRQVAANLLRNALVHTPAGSPIEVRAWSENGSAELEIRDHGPGLPAGDPDTLFERFWRAGAGRERGRDGAGLGLAIVAGIVDAHGGAVSAADAEGGGASFLVRLPLSR
jgi:two-component system OmpR family sensor kinase